MRNQEIRAALEYHEATKHSERSLRANRHVLDFSNQPLPFKIYRDLEVIPLAWGLPERETPALEAISAIGSPHSGERMPDLSVLARVLLLSAGITKRKRYPGGEIFFRAYPNTGALYHVDLYLITCDLQGLAAGVYHFSPHDFALRRLRSGDFRGVLLEASGGNPDLSRAPVILASASTYWRNAWKYQARSYRHCYWDGGTLHANLLAAAEALEPRIVMGFADAIVETLLALDSRREGALTLVPLGRCAKPPPSAPPVPMLRLETEPLSSVEVDYPAIQAVHEASKLATGEEACSWRAQAMPAQPEPTGRTETVPLRPAASAELPSASLDRVIQRRGSTRAFDPTRSLRFDELSTALDRATRGLAADFLAPGASLLDLYVVVHAVEGLPPGAYFYRRRERALEPLREGSFRETAGRLGLFQELPAEAAVNVYSLAALTPLLERFGNRGYRAAQLEGGVTGGRLYLAAYAQGFGATGLTFLDDEVTDFFSPHAADKSVLFLTALGHADRARLS
ncbi:MAG TPA: SagB/ThcOx family dehydrogenase [Myxococcota bacterium]|nr:SagB/ThcOx family dehydrogenase [Myxococcota bacterium]